MSIALLLSVPEIEAIELIRQMMCYCHDNAGAYWKSVAFVSGQRRLERARRAVRQWARNVDEMSLLESEELVALQSTIDDFTPIVAARAIAEVLEELLEDELEHHLPVLLGASTQLQRGELFLKRKAPVLELVGRATSPPEHQSVSRVVPLKRGPRASQRPEELKHLRLVPDLKDFEVSCCQVSSAMGRILGNLVVGCALPHHLKLNDEFDWTPIDEDAFHSVRPKTSTTSFDAWARATAASEGVDVLVYPELSGDQADVAARAAGVSRPLLLCCGGSYGEHRGQGDADNIALTRFSGDSRSHQHRKFNPFSAPGFGTELLSPPRSMRFLVSHNWVVVTLICKDLIDPDGFSILSGMGVSLLLVVSLGDKTDEQEQRARDIATSLQCIVVFVNYAQSGADCSSAFVTWPRRNDVLHDVRRADAEPPGVILFELSQAGANIRKIFVPS